MAEDLDAGGIAKVGQGADHRCVQTSCNQSRAHLFSGKTGASSCAFTYLERAAWLNAGDNFFPRPGTPLDALDSCLNPLLCSNQRIVLGILLPGSPVAPHTTRKIAPPLCVDTRRHYPCPQLEPALQRLDPPFKSTQGGRGPSPGKLVEHGVAQYRQIVVLTQ